MPWTPEARAKAQATIKANREAKSAAKVGPQVKSPSPEAPPPNMFSGTTKKLEVFGKPGTEKHDPIPGFQLYWFDDIEGGLVIQQAKASGWVFVEKHEIALNDANTGPGNNDL